MPGKIKRVFPPATLILLLAACAPAGGPKTLGSYPPDLQQNLSRIEEQQQQLTRQVERLQDGQVLLEARLQDQQKVVEDLRRAMAQKVTPGGEMAAGTTGPASGSPTEIYLQAFGDYTAGRYPQAITGFETFLRHFPDNSYAGNARYWLGECYLAQQQYALASDAFTKMVEEYPQSDKAPEALLKKAEAQLALGTPRAATEVLRTLLKRYPDSAAVRKARNSQDLAPYLP